MKTFITLSLVIFIFSVGSQAQDSFVYDKGSLKKKRWGTSGFNVENNKGTQLYYSSKNSKFSKPKVSKAKGSLPARTTVKTTFGLQSGSLVLMGESLNTAYATKSEAVNNGFHFKAYYKDENGEQSYMKCLGNKGQKIVRASTSCTIQSHKICEKISNLDYASNKEAAAKEIGKEMRRLYDFFRRKVKEQARLNNHVYPLKNLNNQVESIPYIPYSYYDVKNHTNSCRDRKLFPKSKKKKDEKGSLGSSVYQQ